MRSVGRAVAAMVTVLSVSLLAGCGDTEPPPTTPFSATVRPDPTPTPTEPTATAAIRPSPAVLRGLGSSAAWWSQHFSPTETDPCKSGLSSLTTLSWSLDSGDTWCTEIQETLPHADGSPKRDSLISMQLFPARARSEREVLDLVEARLPADAQQLDTRPGRTPGWSASKGTCLSVAYHSDFLRQLNGALLDRDQSTWEFPDVSVLLYSSPATVEGTAKQYDPTRVTSAFVDSDGGHQTNPDGSIPC